MRLKIIASIFILCIISIFAMEDDGYTSGEQQMLNDYVSGTQSGGGRNRQSRSRSTAGGGTRSGHHPHDTGHRHHDYRQQDDYTDDEVDDISRHSGNNPPPPYPGSPEHHGHQDDWDHHHQQQEYGVVNPQQGSAAEFGMSEAEYQEFLERTRAEAHQSRRNNQRPQEALTEQQQLADAINQSKQEYEQFQELQEQWAFAGSNTQPKADPAGLTGAESEALIRLIDSNGNEDTIAELDPESRAKVLKAWTELIRQSAKNVDHQEMALTEVEDWLLQELLNTGDLSVLDVLENNWASRNRVEKAWMALRGPTADGASSSRHAQHERRGAADDESEWERNSRVAQRRPQHGGESGRYVEPGDSEWDYNSRNAQQTQRGPRRHDAGLDSEWDSSASRVPQRTRSRNARNEDEERFVQQRGSAKQYGEAHSYTDWKYNSRGAQQNPRVAESDSETDSNYLRRQAGEAAQRRWRQAEEARRQRGDITESELDSNVEVAQQRMQLVNPGSQRIEQVVEKRARAAEAAQQRARASEVERERVAESDSDNNSVVTQPEEPGTQIAVPNSPRSQKKRIAELAKLEAGMQAFEQLHSRERMQHAWTEMLGSKRDSPRQPHTFTTPGKKINPHQIDDEDEGEEHVEPLVRRKSNRKMEVPDYPEVVPGQSALSSNSLINDHQAKDTELVEEQTEEEEEEESGTDDPIEDQVQPQHTSSANHQQGPIDLHTTDTESDDDQIAHQASAEGQNLADQTPTEEQKLSTHIQKQNKPLEPFSSDSDSEDEKARALRDQKLAAQAQKLLKKPQIEDFYENTDMEDVRQHHNSMSRSGNRSGSGRLGGGGSSESSAKSPAKPKAKNAKSPGDLTAGNRSFRKGSDQTAGRSARDHRSTADVGHGGSASQKSIGGSGRNSFDHRSLGGDQTDASRRNVQQVRAFPDPEALVQANRRSLARVADQYPAGDRTSGSGRMRADQHLLEEQGRNPGGQQPSLNRTGSQRYNDPAKFQANLTKLQRTTGGSSGRRSIDHVSFADQRSAIGGGGGRPSVDQGRNSFYLDANAELELDESEHEPEEHAQPKGRKFGKGWSKLVGSSSSSKSNTAKSLLNKLINLDGKKNKNQE